MQQGGTRLSDFKGFAIKSNCTRCRWIWWSGRGATRAWTTAMFTLFLAFFAVGTSVAWAASVETGQTTVTFSIAEAIEVVSWPPAVLSLGNDAIPGVPVVSTILNISVKANAPWGVQVTSDSNDGTLREYDTNAREYVADGRRVGPLEWATNMGGPWTPVSASPTAIFSNQPPTGEDGVTRGFLLRVTPDFDATALPPGREYRIVLTYTAGVGY